MLEKMSDESIQEKKEADGMLTKEGVIIAITKPSMAEMSRRPIQYSKN